jgi:dinuclear metal center YbgI/SA1388 family protein
LKKVNGQQIIQLFEQFSPKKYAMEGDKIGLQLGTLNKTVENVMIALDVVEDVVDEAIEKNVQLIIAHHPFIFRPLASIQTDQTVGRIVEKLMKHDIALYSAHTNLDVTKGGVNDMLADALKLQNTDVLVPTMEIGLKKLVVFVPNEHADMLRKVLGDAGAGHIGNYSHCSFSNEGTGRFLPQEGTNPYIGSKGILEAVPETKIETIISEDIEKKVITAMLKAHPYEEPAYDIYPLDLKGEVLGLGRVGYLEEEMTLQQFANYVKSKLNAKGVRVTGKLDQPVKKVAILGGDGNKYYHYAIRKGADVYITGDLYYHTAHDCLMNGLNVVDPGHYIESIMKEKTAEILKTMFSEKKWDVQVFPSIVDTDPFRFF